MRKNPCIIIPGLGQSKADLLDENGNFVKKAWPFKLDTKAFAKKLIVPYISSAVLKKDLGFSKAIYSIFSSLLEPLATLPDGTFKHNVVTTKSEMPLKDCTPGTNRYIHKLVPIDELCNRIGEENVYFFSFNAFGEAFDTARMLHEFICKVKEETGADKVDLLAFSLGGPLSIVYLDEYASYKEVDRIVYLVAALDGSPLISEVLRNDIDKTGGEALMSFFFPKSAIGKIMSFMKRLSVETRLNTIDQIIRGSLDTSVRYAPLVWGIVPNELYEITRNEVISAPECEKLREKTDRLHETRLRTVEILENAQKTGIDFTCISGSGHKLMPISKDKTSMGDTTLLIQSSCPNAVITENRIDLSHCVFKDKAYVIEGMSHNEASKNAQCGKILADAFTGE